MILLSTSSSYNDHSSNSYASGPLMEVQLVLVLSAAVQRLHHEPISLLVTVTLKDPLILGLLRMRLHNHKSVTSHHITARERSLNGLIPDTSTVFCTVTSLSLPPLCRSLTNTARSTFLRSAYGLMHVREGDEWKRNVAPPLVTTKMCSCCMGYFVHLQYFSD